jgi:AcrR family transcriptional regulator
MVRTLDAGIDDALADATLSLLAQRGFAAMTIEDVAREAGVGKPAIYRRHKDKAALVVAVVGRQLAELDVPDLGDTREELWTAMTRGFPADGPAYVRLIGGLIAEEERHPELIAAFREHLLLPRRATVIGLVERGQARGDIRSDIDAEYAVDFLAGPLLARVFAGRDTGPRWRRSVFATWWDFIQERQQP